MSPPLSARILCVGLGAALVVALAFAAIDTQAQAPIVLAATSAAHTAEVAYATAVARNASSPNGTPSSPAPLGNVAIAPTPVYAAATQTVAARTAEAGVAMVETNVSGDTPAPGPRAMRQAEPAPLSHCCSRPQATETARYGSRWQCSSALWRSSSG